MYQNVFKKIKISTGFHVFHQLKQAKFYTHTHILVYIE